MPVIMGRAVSFESDGLKVEGLLHLPETTPCAGVVVAHPHPQYGGDMRNLVVSALCEAALAVGAAALRFNFRGAGASEGSFDNGNGEQHDVAAALAYLRSLPEVDGRLALAGYSFGAAVALRLAPKDVRCLVAVSPPTIGGWLSGPEIACPTLFLCGDRDEYCDPEALRGASKAMGGPAQVSVLHGVDHFWAGSTERLVENVEPFLQSHLA